MKFWPFADSSAHGARNVELAMTVLSVNEGQPAVPEQQPFRITIFFLRSATFEMGVVEPMFMRAKD
jgi:hypothetical protein